MAYAAGAGTAKKASRAPLNRPATNGRPASRSPQTAVPAVPRRPSVTFVAGLGVGVAIGVAAALLLAPRSGVETRQALKLRGRKVRNRARDAWDDLRIELEATRRALQRKKRDAKLEIAEELVEAD
jgi:gas vesicle protein